LTAGLGNDRIDVIETASGVNTNIVGNAGDDVVDVIATGIYSNVTIDTGAGADTVTLQDTGIASVTVVNGGLGNDTLTLEASRGGVQLNGQDGQDEINIRSTGGVTVASGGANTDTINISSDAPANAGSLDGILGVICVQGDDHDSRDTTLSVSCNGTTNSNTFDTGDVLNISDAGDVDDNTYTLTATSFWTYTATYNQTIHYATIETLNVTAGTGNDQIYVIGTATGVNTTILADAGDDMVEVITTGAASNVTIDTGAGADTVTLQNTGTGSVTVVHDGSGNDTLTLVSNGAASGVQLNGGSGRDRIDVERAADQSVVAVHGGDDNDAIRIAPAGKTLDGILGTICLDGGGHEADEKRLVQAGGFATPADPEPAGQCTVATASFEPDPAIPIATSNEVHFWDEADDDVNNVYRLLIRKATGEVMTMQRNADPAINFVNFGSVGLALGKRNDRVVVFLTERELSERPVVTINGGLGNDQVDVEGTDEDDRYIRVGVPATDPAVRAPVEVANVELLHLMGRAGDDVIVNDTNVPSLLEGDRIQSDPPGFIKIFRDVLVGGSAMDVIFGDAGADWLFGNAGNDYLFSDQSVPGFLVAPNSDLLQSLDPPIWYADGDVLDGGPGLDSAVQFGAGDLLISIDAGLLEGGACKDAVTWLRATPLPDTLDPATFIVAGQQLANEALAKLAALGLRMSRIEPPPAPAPGLSEDPAPVSGPFQNPANPPDVNADGQVTPLDALLVITNLNRAIAGMGETPQPSSAPFYGDVDGDGRITPADVLQIINECNGANVQGAAGQGEAAEPLTQLAVLGEPHAGSAVANRFDLAPIPPASMHLPSSPTFVASSSDTSNRWTSKGARQTVSAVPFAVMAERAARAANARARLFARWGDRSHAVAATGPGDLEATVEECLLDPRINSFPHGTPAILPISTLPS
jgi:Ca2+-binding RTX toxin-like protein